MNEKSRKGLKCNLSIETRDFYVTIRPIDFRTMQMGLNDELFAEIKKEYHNDWIKQDGNNPDRPFYVYYANMLKDKIDEEISREGDWNELARWEYEEFELIDKTFKFPLLKLDLSI